MALRFRPAARCLRHRLFGLRPSPNPRVLLPRWAKTGLSGLPL